MPPVEFEQFYYYTYRRRNTIRSSAGSDGILSSVEGSFNLRAAVTVATFTLTFALTTGPEEHTFRANAKRSHVCELLERFLAKSPTFNVAQQRKQRQQHRWQHES